MILDKLMEKKDLKIYIRARTAEVRRIKREQIVKLPPKDREQFRQRMIGRLMELDRLNNLLAQDNLKKSSLELWSRNWKDITGEDKSKNEPEVVSETKGAVAEIFPELLTLKDEDLDDVDDV